MKPHELYPGPAHALTLLQFVSFAIVRQDKVIESAPLLKEFCQKTPIMSINVKCQFQSFCSQWFDTAGMQIYALAGLQLSVRPEKH